MSVYGCETMEVGQVRDSVALWEARRRKSEGKFTEAKFRNVEEIGEWVERDSEWTRSFWVEDASKEDGCREMTFTVEFKKNAAVVLNSYFIDDGAF